MACVCTFSRASCRLGRITSSLIGLLVCLRPFWLAEVITLALVSRHSIETRSISVVVFGFMNFQLIQKKKRSHTFIAFQKTRTTKVVVKTGSLITVRPEFIY